MTAGRVTRVLLADNHETVRHGLRLLIDGQADMKVVGEVGTGRLAVEAAGTLVPDVVVLDVSMPEMSGLEAATRIAGTAPGVAIVALTRFSDVSYVQALLSAGAIAYVLKQSGSSELLKAVRFAAEGRRYLDAALNDRVAEAFLARHTTPGPVTRRITDREAEVLRLCAIGHRNKETAQRLSLSVKTIEVHKANAMRKLMLRGRVDVIRYALGQGWLTDA